METEMSKALSGSPPGQCVGQRSRGGGTTQKNHIETIFLLQQRKRELSVYKASKAALTASLAVQ